MKKVIVSLIVSLLAAMLRIVGLNLFKDAGPRERMKAKNGSRIMVGGSSFLQDGDKVFGKIFKPTTGIASPNSLGPRPLIIFFHEPLKTTYPEGLQAPGSRRVDRLLDSIPRERQRREIHGEEDKEGEVRRRGENNPDSGHISTKAVTKATYRLKKSVSGLIMISRRSARASRT